MTVNAGFNAKSTLMLEESLLRVPYETMRKTFKTAQKNIERETTYLKSAGTDAANLSEMISRVKGLKRKLNELKTEQDEHIANTKARVHYLQTLYDIPGIESKQFEDWSSTRLDILLVDYFLRNGYMNTAEAHATTKNINQLVDINVLQQCYYIRKSLLAMQTNDCIAWCLENKQYLKKVRSSLEFEVRLQHSIELIKQGKKAEAVQYNRKHLSKNADTQMHQIQQASGLLAFAPDTDVKQYKELFSDKRWHTLADMFVTTFFSMHGLPSQAELIESLAVGMSALKTYSCVVPKTTSDASNSTGERQGLEYDDDGEDDATSVVLEKQLKPKVDLTRAPMCPVCSDELSRLAKPLPYALHIRCHLDSDPVVLPNGYIYGQEKLEQFSRKSGVESGKICDPTTLEIFDASDMKYVFPT